MGLFGNYTAQQLYPGRDNIASHNKSSTTSSSREQSTSSNKSSAKGLFGNYTAQQLYPGREAIKTLSNKDDKSPYFRRDSNSPINDPLENDDENDDTDDSEHWAKSANPSKHEKFVASVFHRSHRAEMPDFDNLDDEDRDLTTEAYIENIATLLNILGNISDSKIIEAVGDSLIATGQKNGKFKDKKIRNSITDSIEKTNETFKSAIQTIEAELKKINQEYLQK